MSEDSRLAAVTKASSDLGGPFSDIDHEQIAERFIAMYDALRLQQGEEVMQHQPRDRSTLAVDNETAPAAPVTAGADPQPGWYVVLHDGLPVSCIQRISKGWVNSPDELTAEWPYMVFTLGPRVGDLLRDAARYRWLIDHHSWSYPEQKWGEPSPGEAGIRDEWLQSKPGEFPDF